MQQTRLSQGESALNEAIALVGCRAYARAPAHDRVPKGPLGDVVCRLDVATPEAGRQSVHLRGYAPAEHARIVVHAHML